MSEDRPYLALLRRIEGLEAFVSGIRDRLPGEPLKYLSFPKWLYHPSHDGNRYPPVMVNTLEQEAQYRASGYDVKHEDGGEDFFVTKVSERLAKLIATLHRQHAELHLANTRFEARVIALSKRIDLIENPELAEYED